MTTRKGTALVTGASSGIGEATALALQRAGYSVYAGARRLDRMDHLTPFGIRVLQLDVTAEGSLCAAVARINAESGPIDVLVNNAGYGSYGALEDVSMSEARRQVEVNLFGLARLSQLVIPQMRAQRRGTIINVSSVGGKFGEPFGAWYHATKYAVEGLSDSMALELAPFGVKVIVVEPGGIKTEWAAIAADNLVETSGRGAYGDAAKKAAHYIRHFNESRLAGTPEQVARGIVGVLGRHHPRYRYAVAGGAKPLMALRKVTSDRLFYWIFRRVAS